MSESFDLFYSGTLLGTVTNGSADQPWIHGDYDPCDAAHAFRLFFDACTKEEADLPEPGDQFPPEYFDDALWYVVDSAGRKRPIGLPAVHWNEGQIAWRWADRDNV